jgi:hypothetical protein
VEPEISQAENASNKSSVVPNKHPEREPVLETPLARGNPIAQRKLPRLLAKQNGIGPFPLLPSPTLEKLGGKKVELERDIRKIGAWLKW